eukprot:7382570-Prymnesium_polylepis.1
MAKNFDDYLNEQKKVLKVDVANIYEQQKSIKQLGHHWWLILFMVCFIVASIVFIILINLLGARSVYPVLYCWWDNVYKPQRKYCSPNPLDGVHEITPTEITLLMLYPSIFTTLNSLTLVHAFPKIGAEFLILCVERFGEYITPYMWCGSQEQLQGSKDCKLSKYGTYGNCNDGKTQNPKDKDSSLGNCFLPIQYKDNCSFGKIAQAYKDGKVSEQVSGACFFECNPSENCIAACWAQSCQNGNPFYNFFPKEPASFAMVRSINEYLLSPTKFDTKLGVLYQGGLVHLAQEIGTGNSEAFSGAQWFSYMFEPDFGQNLQLSHHADCGAQGQIAGWTGASAGASDWG